jgi:hypothetical protein
VSRIYQPSSGPDAWRQFLAKPELHWKTGYSARALAHCWEAAHGLPPEIADLFRQSSDFAHDEPELLIAIPEHKVPLPGGTTESQNDVFAIVRCGGKTVAAAVEGKVAEPFGETIAVWSSKQSEGKVTRLKYLCGLLGVPFPPAGGLHYQLFHRAASAIIEAERFKTDAAAMIVHSFSPEKLWFAEFAAFASLLGCNAHANELMRATGSSNRPLYLAWAVGDAAFLTR